MGQRAVLLGLPLPSSRVLGISGPRRPRESVSWPVSHGARGQPQGYSPFSGRIKQAPWHLSRSSARAGSLGGRTGAGPAGGLPRWMYHCQPELLLVCGWVPLIRRVGIARTLGLSRVSFLWMLACVFLKEANAGVQWLLISEVPRPHPHFRPSQSPFLTSRSVLTFLGRGSLWGYLALFALFLTVWLPWPHPVLAEIIEVTDIGRQPGLELGP